MIRQRYIYTQRRAIGPGWVMTGLAAGSIPADGFRATGLGGRPGTRGQGIWCQQRSENARKQRIKKVGKQHTGCVGKRLYYQNRLLVLREEGISNELLLLYLLLSLLQAEAFSLDIDDSAMV